jgi:carboxypeptidase C (cathepsin A)
VQLFISLFPFIPHLTIDKLTYFCFAIDTGNKEWFLKLDSVFAKELNKTKERDFSVKGDKAGSLISVGAGAGNYTFLEVYEAGHMVSLIHSAILLLLQDLQRLMLRIAPIE